MRVTEYLRENILLMDGGTGTLLQAAGLPLGELPERWNLTHPEAVEGIHRAYFDAGSHIVCTNTFGANALKFSQSELEEIVRAAVENARNGAKNSVGKQEKFVALDIGPCGKLLEPYGDFAFEEAVELFAKTVRLGVKYGVDLIYLETMGDGYELKAAVLAAKENSDLPLFASCAYGSDDRLTTGATPAATVALLEGLRVDALGVNCSFGPKQTAGIVEELLEYSSLPLLVKPNAGLPTSDGKYDITKEEFAYAVAEFVKKGVRIVGGCCGTTPEYIRALAKELDGVSPLPATEKDCALVSSYTHAVDFSKPLVVGERINPTGKKRLKQALKEGDIGYILGEGVTQKEKGAQVLDVNVGAPEIDEKLELPRYVRELQAVLDLPLQIDTADGVAMERAMRVYNGKPLVNSVNGKRESMDTVFPLVQKYGGVVVALTLDEGGIPDTVEGRVEIAERIIAEAKRYKIPKKDILVDPLAMAISADKNAALLTLGTVKELTKRGIKTSLGVSNVSFGLPSREIVNATFFARALECGLSAAILNPSSLEMMKVYRAHLALQGLDDSCGEYIRFATALPTERATAAPVFVREEKGEGTALRQAIIDGVKQAAATQTQRLLESAEPLAIIDGEIVPALDFVGRAYEEGRSFLPQLLISAEAAKSAFEEIKRYLASKGKSTEKKSTVVLATVQGDIHDVGKNIVGALLENYGYALVDLGRDVPPEEVLAAVLREKSPVVGLSALMTTTLPSMAKTVALLKEKTPWVKIVVGGAVVSEEYARKIGADGYAKDGMATVRLVENWTNV